MSRAQLLNAGWARDQTEKLNSRRAFRFQERDRLGCAETSGQHWINQNNLSLGQIDRQATVISHRREGFLIAIEADVSDVCFRHDSRDSFEHTKTGAQDWNDHY